MRVRIREGLPVEEDMVRALEEFCDTKFLKSRNEMFLNKCPLCGDTDNRADGTQGAIAYSLTKNCLKCAKCGQAVGWKETLGGMGVEWEVEGRSTTNCGDFSAIAEQARQEMGEKRGEKKTEYVDHGDYKIPVNVAADHHVRRLMSPDSKVRPWLESRGFRFEPDYAEHLESAWAGECKAGWLVLLYRKPDGSIRGFKYRRIDEKEFWAQPGVQSEPYGIDDIDESNPTVTWVEGELDRETLRLVYGVPNVFSLPNGANSWKPEWSKYMKHARTCYIGTDSDEEGEKVAAKMFADLPSLGLPNLQEILRLRFVDGNEQRVKDANDALKGGATKEQIRVCYQDAEDPNLVQSERAEINSSGYFIRTGWTTYDEVSGGGCLSGEVTHLAGAPKSGKTTLVVDLHQRLADRGMKTGFVSLDMDTGKIIVRFAMALLGKDDSYFYRTEGKEREDLDSQMRVALSLHHKGLVLFTRDKRIPTYRDALSAIERMGRSGARLITVEDFLSLSVLLESETKGRTVYAGRRIITDLSQVATRCRCHIILVNHLKIDERGGQAYGAGQIGPAAQMNIHVTPERDKDGFTKATIAHIRENRFGSQADVDIAFSFVPGERRLQSGPPVRHKRHGPSRAKAPGNSGQSSLPF